MPLVSPVPLVSYTQFMSFRSKLSAFRAYYMEVVRPIGLVMSKVILTALWLVVFGVYAIITMIFKMLGLHREKTGWQKAEAEPPEHMHYQF